MRPRWGLLWLLGAAASCLLEGSRGSSPRIIRVGYSSATEDCPRLPRFSAEGYVDDQLITRYESHTQKLHPRVDWINTLEKEDPKFYHRYTWILQKDQDDFQENVKMLQERYNQTGGFHIVQMMIFCKVEEDGKRSGYWQYGYDGRNFLEYDMETSSWFTADKEALVIKEKWEQETAIKQRFTGYLESTCMEWLQKNNRYGSKSFLRKEPPVVTMSSRTEVEDGMETHICRIRGFYPKEIDASWRRDGEVWEVGTYRGFLAPNSDGTYYYWISIRIDAKERGRYRCYVEHDSLQEPLELALKESTSNLWLIIGVVVAGGIVACGVAGIFIFLRFKKGDDEPRNEPPCERSPMTSC
ncbi:class I histocompatibility antigen, F10 alpha chain-like isoform X1 [Ahaetulla prasina]|uniref:class I histocompatibility antigen, F10 alpha chain-like isoform X1 n=1 Tax=Ahaetulla prasina TaxID=499056 RepID=UPI0026477AD9|nr:class I histocompatibility antigen, F10 alpha chain-like isoform X1 [Ahaetulla prasina]XP_058022390.1 class I histocompatibility antigen, F10 alpha chain-like isoform X1 [Ahaetulla prasina]